MAKKIKADKALATVKVAFDEWARHNYPVCLHEDLDKAYDDVAQALKRLEDTCKRLQKSGDL